MDVHMQKVRDHMICLTVIPLHNMQVEEVARQLQQMELVTDSSATENETMATQARMLEQGMYV